MARSHNINLISGRIFRTLAVYTNTTENDRDRDMHTCILYTNVYTDVSKTHQNSYNQDTTNVKLMYVAPVMIVPVVKCLIQQHLTLCVRCFSILMRSLSRFR